MPSHTRRRTPALTISFIVLGIAACSSASLASAETASGAATDSPMAALERQHEAILAAASLDEVIHLVPEQQAAYVTNLSPEEKAAGLEEWQQDVRERRPVGERVAGDAAVVLLAPESGDNLGVKLVKMSRVDGSWQVSGETSLLHAVPEAQGQFSVSGGVSAELESGMVSLTAMNGVPFLLVSDVLAGVLDEESDSGKVQIPLPKETKENCFEPGTTVDIGTIASGGEYSVSVMLGFWPVNAAEDAEFDRDARGTLEITSVDEGRFSGSFALTASNEDGETVTVNGTLERALMPCAR